MKSTATARKIGLTVMTLPGISLGGILSSTGRCAGISIKPSKSVVLSGYFASLVELRYEQKTWRMVFTTAEVGKEIRARWKNISKDEKKKFEDIFRQNQESYRDCSWKAKYRHKAKAHARDCGQRQKKYIRKARGKKFECSNGTCELTFPLLSHLQDHYRYFGRYDCVQFVSL